MKVRYFLYFAWLFLISFVDLSAQQYNFRNFSLEEGLPQTEVFALCQDSRGNLWTGTNGGGLSRFNGKTFETYTTRDGLFSNQVYAIFEDSGGTLWIGTAQAVTRYDGLSFKNYTEDEVSFLRVYNIFHEDQEGKIWIGSFDEPNGARLLTIENEKLVDVTGRYPELFENNNFFLPFLSGLNGELFLPTRHGLYELNNGILTFSELNNLNKLSGMLIFPAFLDDQNTLWLIVIDPAGRRNIYTCQDETLNLFKTPDNSWWQGVNLIFKDRNRRTWFGNTGQGIAMISNAGIIKYYRQVNGLSSDFILNFLEDHEGNIWIGTQGGGMMKYSKNTFTAYDFKNIINDNLVRAIFRDSKGNYWFGLAGAGIVKYDGTSFKAFSKDKYPGFVYVRDFVELDRNKMLVLSNNGLYFFDEKKAVSADAFFNLDNRYAYSDALHFNDTLWLATQGNGVFRITGSETRNFNITNSNLNSNQIHSLYKDHNGNLWFCSNSGISTFKDNQLKTYTTDDGLSISIVLQVTQDSGGRYWIATFGGGIDIFDGQIFKHLNTSHGLTSNIIYSILTDKEGNIWAGTQNGVDKIMLDETGNVKNIIHYGVYDGFSGIENNGAANLVDINGNLWFGTVNGAMQYAPDFIETNAIPPPVHITKVKLFFRDIPWISQDYDRYRTSVTRWFQLPENLIFPYDSNHISFEFEAISFQVPEKVKYQWMLDGLDKDWSPLTTKTEAVYPNVPPGKYTFKVRAMNNDGIWNTEDATFGFEIKSPWWETIWFFSLLVIIILTLIAIFVRIRIKMIEKRRNELEILVEEKTAEVVSQNKQLEIQKEEILTQAENLQEAYNNLEYLGEIGRLITSQLTVEKIVGTVYEWVNKLMDATVFGIGLVNENSQALEFRGVKEKGETLDFLSFSLNDKLRLSIYCYRTHKEVFINDFEKEYSKYLPAITPAGKSGNSSSIIYVPLLSDKKVTGVITVQSFEKNAYAEYHLNILRNLAIYTKIAIENAASYRQIEEQTVNLKKANEDIIRQKMEIEKVNKELIELNKEKNHLIEIVAHDLRNPITSSLSIVNNLKIHSDYLNEDDRDSINFMANSLTRMDAMIAKILDIRMIEQKKLNLNCQKTDFGLVLEEVVDNLSEAARKKSIQLHLEKTNIFGIVDRNYLTQVFENLLSNAIKFSPPDKNVWIRMKEQNGEILVHFIDEGPGISQEDMKRLFKKFESLSAHPTAGEKSTGLGLSIVKKYVDTMDGRVWCESEEGKGADFIVSFQKVGP